MKDARFYTRILFVVLFAAIIPVFGMIICTYMLPGWSCETVPLHSVIEFLGLFAGLSLAVLILLLYQHRKSNSYYIIVASALIGMGILDAFHSAVPPAYCSIWLYSIRVLTGGFLFTLVWFSDRIAGSRTGRLLPVVTAFAAAGIGILSITYINTLLALLGSNVFITTVSIVSISGGILFIAATIYFLLLDSIQHEAEKIVFAFFCLLMGTSAFMLPISNIWGAGWWFWHLLYLIANILLLGYVYIVFRKAIQELHMVKDDLQMKVADLAKITETLKVEISERKKAEEELTRKQHEMAAVLSGMRGVAVEYLDPSLTILWANEEVEKEFGMLFSEIRGKHCYEVMRNKKIPCPDCPAYKSAQTEHVYDEEVALPDGRVFLVRCNPVMDDKGSVAGIVHAMINITRLKLAEEELKLKNLILSTQQETSIDGILVLDKEGTVISSNQHFIDICGISPDIIASQSGERVIRSIFDKLVDPLEFLCRVEHLNIHKNEKSREEISLNDGRRIDRYSAPMLGAGDEYLGRVWYFRDITDRRRAEDALKQTAKKLSLLNSIAFTDIQNAVFSLSGYFELEKQVVKDKKQLQYLDKEIAIIRTITESLKFVNKYQNLGLKPPAWQNVQQTFLLGISHLDLSRLSRKLNVEGLEIYADPLLENVFFTLAENIVLHGITATEIALWYRETPEGLTLVFEDNGIGIPDDMKEKIFERRYEQKRGMGLFLAREILSITGITIKETGADKKGAKFEMLVPKGSYRFIS